MKHTFLLFFAFVFFGSSANANEVNTLLQKLDNIISKKHLYDVNKQLKLDSLKTLLINTNDLEDRYNIYHRLYREYRNYNMDTAMMMATEKLSIAKSIHNQDLVIASEMNIAEILGIIGMYKEALDMINSLDRSKIPDDQLGYYYHVHHSTYSLIEESSLSKNEKDIYKRLISNYKDSILTVNPPESLGYRLVKTGKLVEQGKYHEALALIDSCYRENNDERQVGTIAYGLSDVYEKLGDREQQKKFLAISALSDLKRAVKGYIALRKLAVVLYQEGDLDRAYLYIRCSMEDATFCKARFRTLEISETLPIIVDSYDKKMKQEKNTLLKYVVLISVLTIVLAISLFFIYKQLKKLSYARKSMNRMYEDMKKMNEDMKTMNTDLTELNSKLSESNKIKETYIGSVFNFCSTYIDKMESYRIDLNRKLRSGKYEDAIKVSSAPVVADELKEFFRNFDAIFLSLYPNFIEEFNALIKEGKQITPKSGDILSAELRVFALMRLGITDSSKIATFLHYSPQTVYNYKLKIKNKLAVPREDFLEEIQKIGK